MTQEYTGPRWGVTAIPFSHFILNELINKGESQNVIPSGYNTGGAEMFAFTEQGVAMLATILKSPNAVDVSITILRAFVAMRHFLLTNAQIFLRLERVESKQHETDAIIEQVFANFRCLRVRLQFDKESVVPNNSN